ncbi:MAG: transglycosylase SLT domain-containing protein [bacterium]
MHTAGKVMAAIAVLGSMATHASAGQAPPQASSATRAGQALERAAEARQTKHATERFDPIFRKYTKRYFGVGTDWHWFKAQGMAESDLTPTARSRVGARGIMQLMPSTYGQIRTALPQFGAIDNPEWNIAAGILHDRDLWTLWKRDLDEEERWAFVFAGYNAGEGTINRARKTAAAAQLSDKTWPSIESVAPKVERWRYSETLDYVRRIRANHDALNPVP